MARSFGLTAAAGVSRDMTIVHELLTTVNMVALINLIETMNSFYPIRTSFSTSPTLSYMLMVPKHGKEYRYRR